MSDDCIAVNSLYDYIAPELPGCPLAIVDQKINDVLRHFFEETQCYLYEISTIKLFEDQTDYEITDYPEQFDIARIYSVEKRCSEDSDDYFLLDPVNDYGITQYDVVSLVTAPTEDMDDGLRVKIVLSPKTTATCIPYNIYRDNYRVFASGVKSRCMMMSKAPWADAQMAQVYASLYEDGVSAQKIKIARGNLNTSTFFKPGFRFA